MSNKSMANIECECPMNKIIISRLSPSVLKFTSIGIRKTIPRSETRKTCDLNVYSRISTWGWEETLLTLNSISYEYKSI